jgi:VanZ family protein
MFILLGLAYFPVRVGFRFDPQPCELVSSAKYVLLSFTNYGHIIRFALFFAMSTAQVKKGLRPTTTGFTFAAIAGLILGVLVELAEGVTGRGNCRVRDLIPDSVGMLLGALVVTLWHTTRRGRANSHSRCVSSCFGS